MRLHVVSDLEITDMKERTLYFSLVVLYYVLVSYLYRGELFMFTCAVSIVISMLCMTLINTKWKISGHLTLDTLIFFSLASISKLFLLLMLLLPLVAYTRIKLKKHTLLQTVFGVILGCVTFWVTNLIIENNL